MIVRSDSRQAQAVEGDLIWRGENVGANGLAKSKDRGVSSLIWMLDNLETWKDYRSGFNDVQIWQTTIRVRWQTRLKLLSPKLFWIQAHVDNVDFCDVRCDDVMCLSWSESGFQRFYTMVLLEIISGCSTCNSFISRIQSSLNAKGGASTACYCAFSPHILISKYMLDDWLMMINEVRSLTQKRVPMWRWTRAKSRNRRDRAPETLNKTIVDQLENGTKVIISSFRFFVFTDILLIFMIRSQTDILTYTSEQVSPLDV